MLFKTGGSEVATKSQELHEACGKTDLLIKIGRSLVSNLKSSAA